MIIGRWNKGVILTLLGVTASCIGIYFALSINEQKYACICLIIAGVCDLLDGFLARKEKKRTAFDKQFGIELDTVADVINFIVLPTIIATSLGLEHFYEYLPIIPFVLGGTIRLAYFNTDVLKKSAPISYYNGLPVTFTALVFPICFLAISFIQPVALKPVLLAILVLIGLLNIINFHFPKPKPSSYKYFVALAIIVSILLGTL